MTYSTTKFEVATSNGSGGDTFTRNMTDGRTHGRTDGGRTDFDTKLIYPFFLKKKAGIITKILQVNGIKLRRSVVHKIMHHEKGFNCLISSSHPDSCMLCLNSY